MKKQCALCVRFIVDRLIYVLPFVTTIVAIFSELHGLLNPDDHVGVFFWIVTIVTMASTCFFLMESMSVGNHWKTSLNVGALVTLIAAVHYYFYMREFWV